MQAGDLVALLVPWCLLAVVAGHETELALYV
jgi:hypothetical protein